MKVKEKVSRLSILPSLKIRDMSCPFHGGKILHRCPEIIILVELSTKFQARASIKLLL